MHWLYGDSALAKEIRKQCPTSWESGAKPSVTEHAVALSLLAEASESCRLAEMMLYELENQLRAY